MTIETVTHISDLNASYPASSDDISEGDNHIRNIKTALKTDFAAITDAVTADQDDLNRCDVTTPGQINAGEVVTSDGSNVVDCNSASFTNVALTTGTIAGDVTGATQGAGDNSTKLATTAYADRIAKVTQLQSKAVVEGAFNNDTVSSNEDNELYFTNLTTGRYAFELFLSVTSDSTNDFSFDFDTTSIAGSYCWYCIGGGGFSSGISPSSLGFQSDVGIFDTTAHNVVIKGQFNVSNATNAIKLRWAQTTADASWTYVNAGSYFSVTAENV